MTAVAIVTVRVVALFVIAAVGLIALVIVGASLLAWLVTR